MSRPIRSASISVSALNRRRPGARPLAAFAAMHGRLRFPAFLLLAKYFGTRSDKSARAHLPDPVLEHRSTTFLASKRSRAVLQHNFTLFLASFCARACAGRRHAGARSLEGKIRGPLVRLPHNLLPFGRFEQMRHPLRGPLTAQSLPPPFFPLRSERSARRRCRTLVQERAKTRSKASHLRSISPKIAEQSRGRGSTRRRDRCP